MLPVIAIIATGVLIYQEWARLEYPLLGRVFDLISASGGAVSFALYRIIPLAPLLELFARTAHEFAGIS